MISSSVARVALVGSYRRDRPGLARAYNELIDTNCQVLSPRRLDFDDAAFVRDAVEYDMSVGQVERHHLNAIRQSDFVWLHAPHGHIGTSGAFEIGFAYAHQIPIFSSVIPEDILIREYVTPCSSVFAAKQMLLDQV